MPTCLEHVHEKKILSETKPKKIETEKRAKLNRNYNQTDFKN